MRRGAEYAWRERHPASSSSTSRDDEPPASVNRRGMSAVLLPRRRSRLRPGIVAVQIESNRDDRSGSFASFPALGRHVGLGTKANAHRVGPFCVAERVNVPGALCRRGYVYGAPRLPAQRTVIESQSKRRLRFLAEVVSNFFWRVCFSFEPIVLFLENPSECRTTYREQR